MKFRVLLLCFLNLHAMPAFAENIFVCKSELATGFIYK